MEDTEHIRQLVCQRIADVERAVKSLQTMRKSLLHKAYQAKQDILNAFTSERESARAREMSMLIEVDNLLHSRDDALITQLSKLNQVLGCLRNCLESPHPCGDCLEKFEDIDMVSVEEADIDFSSANNMLGQTDSTLNARQIVMHDVDDEGMTKWLLTPTNNHLSDLEEKQGQVENVSTEWLLQYHSQTTTGVEAGNHFMKVKAEKRDNWLSEEETTHCDSLYTYVFTHFDVITEQDNNAWLQQQQTGRERKESMLGDYDSRSSETSTSSLGSSCVIVTSSATSESSKGSAVLGDLWPQDFMEDLPLNDRVSNRTPYQVNEWVASCGTDADWLVHARSRLSSLSSVTSATSLQRSVSGDWLATEQTTPINKPQEDTECWLARDVERSTVSPADTVSLLKEDLPTENMLPFTTLKSSFECDEKCDQSFEKTVDEDWLTQPSMFTMSYSPKDLVLLKGLCDLDSAWLSDTPSSTSYKKSCDLEVWLSGEEKADLPQKELPRFKPDREWLLIMNQMSKISASEDSEWLVNAGAAVKSSDIPKPTSQSIVTNEWLV